MQLEQSIKTSGTSSTFGDVSQIELAPIPYGYPEYVKENGKIHSVSLKRKKVELFHRSRSLLRETVNKSHKAGIKSTVETLCLNVYSHT